MDDIETQKPSRLRAKHEEEEMELEEADYQDVDWKRFLTWRYVPAYLAIIAIIVLIILIAVDKNQIVTKLEPIAQKIRAIPAGWVIPIVILIVLSIPPLFGHEIIALLCGIVYGLGIGFGIVAAGTFLGELLTWYLFKYVLQRRARKLELTNLNYGALAKAIRDGGFWIIVLVRLSVVPSHMSTAVFATCGTKFWHFVIASFLALPKQLVIVYLGVLLGTSANDKVAKALVFVIGGLLTVVASAYMFWKLRVNRKILLEEQAQRKQAKRAREGRGGAGMDIELDGGRQSLAEANRPLMA